MVQSLAPAVWQMVSASAKVLSRLHFHGATADSPHTEQPFTRAFHLGSWMSVVVHGRIVTGPRVGATTEQRRAEAVVDCRRRVVIRTHAVGASTVRALATGGVGTLVEVQSERVEAAEHDGI